MGFFIFLLKNQKEGDGDGFSSPTNHFRILKGRVSGLSPIWQLSHFNE